MTIRTDADIINLCEQGALTSAEEALIENCRAGKPTVLGEDVPDGPSDARTVRAELLRYLICVIVDSRAPAACRALEDCCMGGPSFSPPLLIVCGR